MSHYDNEELLNLSPPLPPKMHQKAPPIPPKLNLDHKDIILISKKEEKSLKKGTKVKSNSSNAKPKNNSIVQNEGYRFVDHTTQDFDIYKRDSGLIYENKNIILTESVEKCKEPKTKSILSRMKNIFTRKHLKKIKSKDSKDNDCFSSSHRSEKMLSSYITKSISEMSDEECTRSELNQSWYGTSRRDSRYNQSIQNMDPFHVHRVPPQSQHCHFNCVQMCQIHNQFRQHNHCCHHFQLDHVSEVNGPIHNLPNISRCFNCQLCICNTHCHSRTPSFGNFTSFSGCRRSLQSNHDRHFLDNNPTDFIDMIADSRVMSSPNSVLPVVPVLAQEIDPLAMSLHENLQLLRKVGWYWGPLKSEEAEEIMADRSDGTFIVRDSSHAEYLFSITFRVNNNTNHTRIQFSQNKFWLNQEKEADGFKTVIDLINVTVNKSQNGQFSYFQNTDNLQLPTYAVILLYPLSRFRIMTSLKHIARFVIISRVRNDHLDRLPLPEYLVSYLQDKDHHYVENFYHYVHIMKATDTMSIT